MTDHAGLPFSPATLTRAHSIWAASASERWFACPGSINLIGGEEGTASLYAREGSYMHRVAEQCLRPGSNRTPEDFVGDVDDAIEFTEEFAEAVGLYRSVVLADQLDYGGRLLVEHKFDLSEIWPGLFGTNDACLLGDDGVMRVYDYKGGKGVPVEVEGNTQELIYAVGAWRDFKAQHQFHTVELVIVQPRCPHRHGPVRRWQIDVVDLWDWIETLKQKLSATMDPDAPLIAGDHCVFCPARSRCPALRDFALAQARLDFAEAPPMPSLLSPTEIVALLPKLDLLDEFVRAVKAHAKALAEAGTDLPGYKLVAKRAMREWVDPDATPAALRDLGLTEAQIYTEPELRSPAQIEKQLPSRLRHHVKAPRDIEAASTLVVARSSGNNLVPIADIRGNVPPSVLTDFKPLD